MTVTVPRSGARTIDVAGFPLRVRVQGTGDPLLLLNGLTRPLESWRPFTGALHGRQVITVDAPGVGASPAPRLSVSVSLLARLAVSVLDEVGVARADVLGFSHGGAVAQQLAADAPGRVRCLVLVSTSCGVGAEAGRVSLRRLLAAPWGDASWPRPDVLGTTWHVLAVSGWSSIPFLGAIAAPTLVVSGEHDRVVPPGNSRLLARRIPDSELALLAAGHDLQRRGQAELLASTVEDFLQRKGSADV